MPGPHLSQLILAHQPDIWACADCTRTHDPLKLSAYSTSIGVEDQRANEHFRLGSCLGRRE